MIFQVPTSSLRNGRHRAVPAYYPALIAPPSPVHNRPLPVDGSDAGGIGFSALPVRISGTPPREEIVEDHHADSRKVELTLFDDYSTIIVWRTQPIFPSSRPPASARASVRWA